MITDRSTWMGTKRENRFLLVLKMLFFVVYGMTVLFGCLIFLILMLISNVKLVMEMRDEYGRVK